MLDKKRWLWFHLVSLHVMTDTMSFVENARSSLIVILIPFYGDAIFNKFSRRVEQKALELNLPWFLPSNKET